MRESRPLGLSLAGTPPLRNHMKPLEILSEDQLMAVHEASMDLLENIGIEFMGQAARDKFRAAGATVDDETGLVKIPREVVAQA
ncbi:MAG TPA: trimethylamine methyltransferase family protein, partial [Verrucomicrobiae bacterium]|nr:trimethylamine methyltransferase family protein [Verrucomicrobiae bacterium]